MAQSRNQLKFTSIVQDDIEDREWMRHENEYRASLNISPDAPLWTDSHSLEGISNNGRYLACINLANFARLRCPSKPVDWQVDVSQAITRKPWGNFMPFAQKSIIYDFRLDRCLDMQECCQHLLEDYIVMPVLIISTCACDVVAGYKFHFNQTLIISRPACFLQKWHMRVDPKHNASLVFKCIWELALPVLT